MRLRIGSVPYLNAKPLVDWFHSPECDADVELIYAVPSQLAVMLREGEIDVCNCSIFESMRSPGLCVVPGVSISSDGPVKSVRLFCSKPVDELKTVALDTSSLTSSALTHIILSELYHIEPEYHDSQPDLNDMLAHCDAGLIIGDLKLFNLHEGTTVIDLGECWQRLTGLPFVYAAWQAPVDKATPEMVQILTKAKSWGVDRLEQLAQNWSAKMDLPYERCLDYFVNAMCYELDSAQIEGMKMFQRKCYEHGLIESDESIRLRDEQY